jgi:hypothetical protein
MTWKVSYARWRSGKKPSNWKAPQVRHKRRRLDPGTAWGPAIATLAAFNFFAAE